MTLYLSKYLTRDHIDSIKSNFGFTNPQIIEKFVMDFEMQYQISQEMYCVTRGGLCVPFHLSDHHARRLSEDIDLVTPLSLEETKSIIEGLKGNITEIRIDEHIPKNPMPLPMVRYKAYYKSCYGRESSIKIDILCDTNTQYQEIKIIPAGFDVFAFNTPGEISVLDHGSLIGDKLSTLSLTTPIGLHAHEDDNSITKQIYDMGTLLRLITKDKLPQALETFQRYTDQKIQRFKAKLSIDNITSDVESSLAGFLQTDKQLTLESEHSRRYVGFKGNYLGSNPYTASHHISDILLIRLFNRTILDIRNGAGMDEAFDKFTGQVNQLNQIRSIEDGVEIARVKNGLLDNLLPSIPKKILRGSPPEHIFLLQEILNRS